MATIEKKDEAGNVTKKSLNVMNKEQFRNQMGILGQQENAFLADRIFEVFDINKDGVLSFEEYL